MIRRQLKELKERKGVIYFADMIGLTTNAIQAGAPLPYRHMLADEYQDSTPQQVKMLEALATRCRSVVVAGDPLQAIYGWAGSRYTRFDPKDKEVQRLKIDVSRRLNSAVAAVACALTSRPASAIVTSRKGERPTFSWSSNHVQQARSVATQIATLATEGVAPGQIVALARRRAVLRALHGELLAARVPCTLVEKKADARDDADGECDQGGDDGGSRNAHAGADVGPLSKAGKTPAMRAIKDIVRLLRLVDKCKHRTINKKKLRAAMKGPVAYDANWDQARTALRAIRSPSLEGRFTALTKIYLLLCGGQRANKVLRNLLNQWAAVVRTIVADSSGEAIEALAQMLGQQKAKSVDNPTKPGNKPHVMLTTIHAAKGGEWEHVFVLGLVEGVLPDHRSLSEQQLEEERRLLYVAVTRARQKLYLFGAPTMLANGNSADRQSRFLRPALRAEVLTAQ